MKATPAAFQAYSGSQHRNTNFLGRGSQGRLASRLIPEDKVDMATKSLLLKPEPLPLSSKLIQAGAALSNSSKLRSLPGGETIVAALATATAAADTVSRHLEVRGRRNRGLKSAPKQRNVRTQKP